MESRGHSERKKLKMPEWRPVLNWTATNYIKILLTLIAVSLVYLVCLATVFVYDSRSVQKVIVCEQSWRHNEQSYVYGECASVDDGSLQVN